MPTFARVESSSLGMAREAAVVAAAEDEIDGELEMVVGPCEDGDDVAVADEVDVAAAVVASLNCHPLKGMPITLVTAVAVAEVLTQPASPSKSLANW
jgi:hypothetical protein